MKKVTYDITPEDLKKVREESGFTQERFAQDLGVATITVKKWECGDSLPSLKILYILARKFNIVFQMGPDNGHPILIQRQKNH